MSEAKPAVELANVLGRLLDGGSSQKNSKKKTSNAVPNRADNSKRRVNFYHQSGDYSHTADVRFLKSGRPHAGDVKRNTGNLGGVNWTLSEHDYHPDAPKGK
jgi:hypothetical protein